ncbi:MAG: hypothetical protein AAFV95_18570 [Bacteroidota bacterium]
MKVKQFLVCCWLLVGSLAHAQVGFQMPLPSIDLPPLAEQAQAFAEQAASLSPSHPAAAEASSQSLPPSLRMPSLYCYDDLAFFCKIEVKLEKAARLPVRFRLGDVQYVDRLEGKNTGHFQNHQLPQ